MKNLPAKYTNDGSEQATESAPNKIKLRLPGHALHNATQDPVNGAPAASSGTVRIRVPVQAGASNSGQNGTAGKASKSNSPEVNTLPSMASSSSQVPQTPLVPVSTSPHQTQANMPALSAPTPTKPITSTLPKPSLPTQRSQTQPSGPSHISPQTFYAAPSPSQTPASSVSVPATPAPSLPLAAGTQLNRTAPSPAPHPSAAGMYSVRLEMCPLSKGKEDLPRRRLATLTKSAGVRSFALTVPSSGRGPGSGTRVFVRGVKFVSPPEDTMDVDGPKDAVAEATPVKKKTRGRPRKTQSTDMDTQENHAPELESRMDREINPPSLWAATFTKSGPGTWVRPSDASDVVVRFDGKDVTPSSRPASESQLDSAQSLAVVSEIASVLATQLNGTGNSSENGSVESDADAGVPQNINGGIDPSEALKEVAAPWVAEDEWAIDVSGAGRHVLEIGRKDSSVPWQVFLYVV